MQVKVDLSHHLCELNNLIASNRHRIPESRRGSVPQGGFTFRLPRSRKKGGTDELLAKAQEALTLGKPRNSRGFEEAYYFAHLDDYFPSQAEVDFELPDPTAENSSRGTIAPNNRNYLSSVPDHGMIGHAEMELVIDGARKRFRASADQKEKACAAKVLLTIGCFCPYNEVHHLRIGEDGKTITRRPPPSSKDCSFIDHAGLHQDVTDCIKYAVPSLLIEALTFLLRIRNEDLPDKAVGTLFVVSITPFVTIATIEAYLLYTGSDRWGYSPVLPVLSFRGIGTRPGVFASYVRASKLLRSMAPLYQFMEADYCPPAFPIDGYGCDHVPKISEIRDYYAAWRSMGTLPASPLSPCEIVKWQNAYVAGLHQFGCLFFGGLRNYPGAAPSYAEVSGSFIINKEKTTQVPTLWSKCLVQGLIRYREVKSVVGKSLSSSGWTVEWPNDDAYCYLEPTEETVFRPCLVNCINTFAALEDYTPLSRWANLHPNALRAAGMTLLYEGGEVHSHDIEAFYGRFARAQEPTRKHRCEDTSMAATRSRIEAVLYSSLHESQ